ncbi:hypothetical protein [Dehalobacter sp. TBBPA1]|uniref:hypothetical protein n=1 Tax=Dehalobacter sp. TBBPA1 TaxID=3235037 RepID=UPI0034A11758
MTKNMKAIGFSILGILLIVIGFVLIKAIHEPQRSMQVLPYICVGIGCGLFGHHLGKIISNMALKNYPDEVRKIEIEQNDERNLTITNKAKAKAYDKMIYVYGATILAFGLMQIDLMAIIILVISYLFVVFSGIYYRSKYEKEM